MNRKKRARRTSRRIDLWVWLSVTRASSVAAVGAAGLGLLNYAFKPRQAPSKDRWRRVRDQSEDRQAGQFAPVQHYLSMILRAYSDAVPLSPIGEFR